MKEKIKKVASCKNSIEYVVYSEERKRKEIQEKIADREVVYST